ncbi:hypothetical protein MNBD_IGNAVI01-570 [hydrothermal vent metagenome]|uniref:Co-chaperone DjlA N-terminal domain-containing protein n=1 Tax=hydrothermal vent metagenome TaxID=652676 RepID=A0A3B1C0G0_9ZZZZ
MFDFLKNMIADQQSNETPVPFDDEKRIQIATCALFLEIANADDEFSVEEENLIELTMKKIFNLDDKTVAELIDLSVKQTEKSVSIYEFTDIINHNFDQNAKYEILKNLWRLVYADGKLDQYEDYFMRKISGNLHLDHSDMIAAKMEVKEELKN